MKAFAAVIFVVIIAGVVSLGLLAVGSKNSTLLKSGDRAQNEAISDKVKSNFAENSPTGIGGLTPTAKPSLAIRVISPVNGTTVKTSSVLLKGQTSPMAEVYVNDFGMSVDSKGLFQRVVSLDEGENYILVAANDADGNSVEKEVVVTYDTESN